MGDTKTDAPPSPWTGIPRLFVRGGSGFLCIGMLFFWFVFDIRDLDKGKGWS
jgi:hypothetical protein